MKRYLAVIERTSEGWGAYVPDIPGVIAAADTYQKTKELIEEGIEIWMEETRADGLPVPEPVAQGVLVECV
jgi:predicted RNase H-like HicB family nuclease